MLPPLPPTPVRQAESAMAAATVPLHKKGGKVEEGWRDRSAPGGRQPSALERRSSLPQPARGTSSTIASQSRDLPFAEHAPGMV